MPSQHAHAHTVGRPWYEAEFLDFRLAIPKSRSHPSPFLVPSAHLNPRSVVCCGVTRCCTNSRGVDKWWRVGIPGFGCGWLEAKPITSAVSMPERPKESSSQHSHTHARAHTAGWGEGPRGGGGGQQQYLAHAEFDCHDGSHDLGPPWWWGGGGAAGGGPVRV